MDEARIVLPSQPMLLRLRPLPLLRLRPLFFVLALAVGAFACADDPKPPPIACGNGILEAGEVCEGDPLPEGCNPNTCQIVAGYECTTEEPDSSDPEALVSSECGLICGNGRFDDEDEDTKREAEECDLGSLPQSCIEDLGICACEDCKVNRAWDCVGFPSVCTLRCPNGIVDAARGENCDDNNAVDGDGCNSRCRIEQGWTCQGMAPSVCGPEPEPPASESGSESVDTGSSSDETGESSGGSTSSTGDTTDTSG